MTTFHKHRSNPPHGFFAVEAAGLRWLAEPDALPVVGVIDVGEDFIELDRLTTASPTPAMAEEFGRGLAALHDAGASTFGAAPDGWDGDGFIGDAPLPLRTEDTWGVFYARHRVLPYARAAADAGALSASGLSAVEAVCTRLADGAFDDGAAPARLHGDLWSGNVVWTASGATLIDPAAHGGHRVTDLAMLALFGLPFLARVQDAYAEASRELPHHWRDLVPLHQLHPLLVHAVLFGGGYGRQAADAARATLAL